MLYLLEIISFQFFLLAAAVQVFYFLYVFARLIFFKPTPQTSNSSKQRSVSVIVCSHNDLINLKNLIPLLLAQKHNCFEILVVNDRSTDGTAQWLQSLHHPLLRSLTIDFTPELWTSKKYALDQGIAVAKNEIILLTDADCIPTSDQWIRLMTEQISKENEACIGYAPYHKESGFLNLLIRFETLYTAIQYLSYTLWGHPYMGVGRNMAYKKSFYNQNKQQVEKTKNIIGGDDDLFTNKAFTHSQVAIVVDSAASMYSKAKQTWSTWYWQKLRHLNTGKYYQLSHKFRLGMWLLSQCGFYLTSFILLFQQFQLKCVLIVIIFRTLLIIYIFVRITKKLDEKIRWYLIPLLDMVYTLSYIFIGASTYIRKINRWN